VDIATLILLGIASILVVYAVDKTEKASKSLNDIEQRITAYARKIKKIEDIVIKAEQTNEFAVITLKEIKKELFPNDQSDK